MAAAESSLSEEVSKLMGQGKRHLVCIKVAQAVKCFEEATQKLEKEYGSGADECGEAYLFYGKALLELARAETGVLGNVLKDVESKSGESSDEDEDNMEAPGADTGEEKGKEGKGQHNKEKKAETEEKDKESKDKSDEGTHKTEEKGKDESEQGKSVEATPKEEADEEMKEEKEKEKDKEDEEEGGSKEEKEHDDEEGETKGEEEEGETKVQEEDGGEEETKGEEEGDGEEDDAGEEGENGENEEEEGEEEGQDGDAGATTVEGQEEDTDIPTMQLAWESLELAHLVFSRHDNKEAHLNLAEVHLKLGEIQLEQEQFGSAVTDFLKCLELQEKHLEPDDRFIAETSYNLGLAYSFQPNYGKAKEFYSKALKVIQLKISKLEARLAESDAKDKGKGKATDDDPCVVDRKELQELQNLYPEIKARVDDAEEMMNSAASQLESTTEEGFGSSTEDKSDVPVNTIPIKKVSNQQPANDVSHLMRRKRKPEEESSSAGTEDTGIPTKKARQDEEQQAAPVVTENGHGQN